MANGNERRQRKLERGIQPAVRASLRNDSVPDRIRAIVNSHHCLEIVLRFLSSLGITIRFVASLGFGQLIGWLAIGKFLWPRLEKKQGKVSHNKDAPTWALALVERTICMTALMVGAWQFIGVWLAVKAAVRWRAIPKDKEYGSGTDIIWLTGTGLNLFLAFLGGCFTLWGFPSSKLPSFKLP
jgi:hypothetical protein